MNVKSKKWGDEIGPNSFPTLNVSPNALKKSYYSY